MGVKIVDQWSGFFNLLVHTIYVPFTVSQLQPV